MGNGLIRDDNDAPPSVIIGNAELQGLFANATIFLEFRGWGMG